MFFLSSRVKKFTKISEFFNKRVVGYILCIGNGFLNSRITWTFLYILIFVSLFLTFLQELKAVILADSNPLQPFAYWLKTSTFLIGPQGVQDLLVPSSSSGKDSMTCRTWEYILKIVVQFLAQNYPDVLLSNVKLFASNGMRAALHFS